MADVQAVAVDGTGLNVVELRGEPPRAGTGWAVREGEVLRWSTRPGRWRAMGCASKVPVSSLAASADPSTWTDLTHAMTVIRPDRDLAERALSHLCPFDVRQLGPGQAVRVGLAQVVVEIITDDANESLLWLMVSRSWGVYLAELLAEAGASA